MTPTRTTLSNEEREVDPEAAERVAAMDLDPDNEHEGKPPVPSHPTPKPGYRFDKNGKERKIRSDLGTKVSQDEGKPKEVKPVAATQEVVSKRIYTLSERVAKAAAKIGMAKDEFEAAKTELQSYMDAL